MQSVQSVNGNNLFKIKRTIDTMLINLFFRALGSVKLNAVCFPGRL